MRAKIVEPLLDSNRYGNFTERGVMIALPVMRGDDVVGRPSLNGGRVAALPRHFDFGVSFGNHFRPTAQCIRRSGPTGCVSLFFDATRMTFRSTPIRTEYRDR